MFKRLAVIDEEGLIHEVTDELDIYVTKCKDGTFKVSDTIAEQIEITLDQMEKVSA